MSPSAGENRDNWSLSTRKAAERTLMSQDILDELVKRMWGNGSFHLDTDSIDLADRNDYYTMMWLARIVSHFVIEERRRIENTIVHAYSAIHADGERAHYERLYSAQAFLEKYIKDNPDTLNLWNGPPIDTTPSK